jgi:hypothetical protein
MKTRLTGWGGHATGEEMTTDLQPGLRRMAFHQLATNLKLLHFTAAIMSLDYYRPCGLNNNAVIASTQA